MNTLTPTTIVVGAGGAVASTVLSNIGEEEVRNKRRNAFIGTAIASTATVAVGSIQNTRAYANYDQKQLDAEQARQAYVDSLSDEELEMALRQMEQQPEYDQKANVESAGNYRK